MNDLVNKAYGTLGGHSASGGLCPAAKRLAVPNAGAPWRLKQMLLMLTLCACVLTASCGKHHDDLSHIKTETATQRESIRNQSNHLAKADLAHTLYTNSVGELVDAYRAAMTAPDSHTMTTTLLLAAHLPLNVLKDRALLSENPLNGMIYAEALLEHANDDETRSYARLRIAQHAAVLYDYVRAAQELHQIPDDTTTVTSENRMYEKYLALAEVYTDMSDYEGAHMHACKLLDKPVVHPPNARLRPSLLLCAATCAANINDAVAARHYLSEAAGHATQNAILGLTVANAKCDLADFDQFFADAQDTRRRGAERRLLYSALASRPFDEVMREREAVVGRPLTSVERVQLLNLIRTVSPHYNP